MAFLKVTSPHTHKKIDTGGVMRQVLLATLPGVAALTYFFGWGTLINIAFACALALIAEAIVLVMRKRPVGFYLSDCSALVTAVLLGIALPPYAPYWITMVGILFAIVIAKHLYGGMGYNPFNPAMVAYVVLLISFPVQMTSWSAPIGAVENQASFGQALSFIFNPSAAQGLDAFTSATPLDIFKQNQTATVAQLWQDSSVFGQFGGLGWEWVNVGFLIGGLYLLARGIYSWHAPISMLISLSLMALFFYDSGSSASGGSPLMHLFTGATMFGAFFIVTDPVTSAVSERGRIIYGACIGVLIFLIRDIGNYPDAVAFSVLLMNFAAPLIDQYTQPRVYGHSKEKN